MEINYEFNQSPGSFLESVLTVLEFSLNYYVPKPLISVHTYTANVLKLEQ